ncbi:MAG: TetR/AcrR family transcriptional regulator [Elusimicrobiales bacterium]|nr:TetR/AcrR family transcriptional regulator [Elusimicrobiales bacterium]
MARPSSGSDLRLVTAGKKLALKRGLTGLNVREICREAEVNLGMFYYYFRSKREFEQRLLKEMYAEFMRDFRLGVENAGEPRERLKTALLTIGKFARDNRQILAALIKDVVGGKKETVLFIKENFTAHVMLLLDIVEQCREAGALRRDASFPNMLMLLVLPLVVPCGAVGVAESNGFSSLLPVPLIVIKQLVISDKAMEQRVELALAALEPRNKI